MDDSTKYCSVFNSGSSETVAYITPCEYDFGGASYYRETFKKYYGMPPLIYKKFILPDLCIAIFPYICGNFPDKHSKGLSLLFSPKELLVELFG